MLRRKGLPPKSNLRFPPRLGWATAEYVLDCHMYVECYRGLWKFYAVEYCLHGIFRFHERRRENEKDNDS